MQIMTEGRVSRHSWWMLLVRGILALLFGILTLVWPHLTLIVLVAFFGAYSLVDGIFAVVVSLQERQLTSRWWVLLIEGIVGIVVTGAPANEPLVGAPDRRDRWDRGRSSGLLLAHPGHCPGSSLRNCGMGYCHRDFRDRCGLPSGRFDWSRLGRRHCRHPIRTVRYRPDYSARRWYPEPALARRHLRHRLRYPFNRACIPVQISRRALFRSVAAFPAWRRGEH